MPPDRSAQPDSDPVPDDLLAGLRKVAALAKELGVSDVGTFTEMLDAARSEGRGAEVFKPLKALVEQFAGSNDSTKSVGELGARLRAFVVGREAIAERQYKTEMALLRRIEELSSTAPTEGLVDLVTAYTRLRGAGYVPEEHPSARDATVDKS